MPALLNTTLSQTNHNMDLKWDVLFEKNSKEWIAFKPRLGLYVYTCYSCKQMFSSKITFLDHINRRATVLKYPCQHCSNSVLTFYNKCTLLLHARAHFSLQSGELNLSKVTVQTLPIGMAGFMPYPNIPLLYDVEDDSIEKDTFINSQFYSSDYKQRGRTLITLLPNKYVYNYIDPITNESITVTLKQVSSNIPRCVFVRIEEPQTSTIVEPDQDVEIKAEPIESEFTIPIISKIESLNESIEEKTVTCPECKISVNIPLSDHFLDKNLPKDESLRCAICKFIAPTKCCLLAHKRIHNTHPPYVCPECGIQFGNSELLRIHMESVCYHLSKGVRYRCPGRRCGKLFTLTSTYSSHFPVHMEIIYKCSICSAFVKPETFLVHASHHDRKCDSVTLYKCSVCRELQTPLNEVEMEKHVQKHINDTSRCMYIYLCKYCRSCFRSTGTFSMHLKKCVKLNPQLNKSKVVELLRFITTTCEICNNKLSYREDQPKKICNNCQNKPNVPPLTLILPKKSADKKYVCILCNKQLPATEKGIHMQQCKYSKAYVVLEKLDSNSKHDEDNNNRKKRKRPNIHNNSTKSKKLSIESHTDLQADQPIEFNGTYYCKLCSYLNTNRSEFHEHILIHRDISTAYQCMECGECFVVKPSLVKHLRHYHNISDFAEYLKHNDCYDKIAVKELEESMRMVPGEKKLPLKENQCRICREQFSDSTELKKHFRVHGMAFLLTNAKN